MRLQEIPTNDLEAMEVVRKAFKIGSAIGENEIANVINGIGGVRIQKKDMQNAVQLLISFGFLSKEPTRNGSDFRIYDLTEKGRSHWTLNQFIEKEKENEAKALALTAREIAYESKIVEMANALSIMADIQKEVTELKKQSRKDDSEISELNKRVADSTIRVNSITIKFGVPFAILASLAAVAAIIADHWKEWF